MKFEKYMDYVHLFSRLYLHYKWAVRQMSDFSNTLLNLYPLGHKYAIVYKQALPLQQLSNPPKRIRINQELRHFILSCDMCADKPRMQVRFHNAG